MTSGAMDLVEPGKFFLRLEVSDGHKAKVHRFQIAVRARDADPLRNKKPVLQKLGRVQAFAGAEISIPLVACDADGDPLTYSATGLAAGMRFDPSTTSEDPPAGKRCTWSKGGERSRELAVSACPVGVHFQ